MLAGGETVDLRIVHPAAIRNPTYFTRMDPQARRATWDLIRAIREQVASAVDLIVHQADTLESTTDQNDPAVGGTPETVALEIVGERTETSTVLPSLRPSWS